MRPAALVKPGEILRLIIYAAFFGAQDSMGLCREAAVVNYQLQNQAFRQKRSDVGAEMKAEIALAVKKIGALVALLFSDGMRVL